MMRRNRDTGKLEIDLGGLPRWWPFAAMIFSAGITYQLLRSQLDAKADRSELLIVRAVVNDVNRDVQTLLYLTCSDPKHRADSRCRDK